MSVLNKVLRVIKSPNTYQRTIQAINKSPLRYLSKTLAILFHLFTYLKRKKMLNNVTLNSMESQALNQLKEYGYAEVANLVSNDDLEVLYEYGTEKLSRAEKIKQNEATKTKAHWVRLSDEDIGDKAIDSANPMVKAALQESLLKVVGKYINQAPFLEYVLLTFSNYSGPELKSSQLWHFDRDDTHMLKFFVYLTDVNTIADGPFTFIDKIKSEKIENDFFMRHLQDSEIEKTVKETEFVRMIKPKLSCFVVDTTRCYHMGSRVHEGHNRLLFTSLFIGLPSNYSWAGKEKYKLNSKQKLSDLQLAALQN